MSRDSAELLRTAFSSYLTHREKVALEPFCDYLPYDIYDIESRSWSAMGDLMVMHELCEITNILNDWQSSLRKWHAWNAVIQPYDMEDALELWREFLEANAHHCLLKPSAVRDALGYVVTNSMHQVRLSSENGYRDFLEGDPKTPDARPRYLTRREKENRLAKLISNWPQAERFMASLRTLDDQAYKKKTSDYRNRSSHAVGPMLGLGITQMVVRRTDKATQMVQQADGTWDDVPIPGKMAVFYSFGGSMPLDMEAARVENLEQYERARKCYEIYLLILDAGLKALPLKS